MCPSVAVMGGGGGGGGGSGGSGGSGDGSASGDGSGDGANASGDGKNGGQGCGDPVCPITGRVFLELYDFGFAGPQPLRWVRQYNSRESRLAGELGFGWTHAYGWWLREGRDGVEVFDDGLRRQAFSLPPGGAGVAEHPLGYRLARSGGGFVLLDREGNRRVFGAADPSGVCRLVEVSDRNGNKTTVERDHRGHLTGLTDSAGRPYRVVTDGAGRVERVLVAGDAERTTWLELVRYQYDDAGNLAAAIDAEGFGVRYEYQGHLLVAHHSPSGPTYRWRYDGPLSDARCVETWGEEGGGMPAAVLDEPRARGTAKGIYYQAFHYGPDHYTEVEDGLGGRHRYFGDATGRVVKEVTPAGGVITRAFDPKTGVQHTESRPDGRQAEAQLHQTKPIGYTSNAGDGIGAMVDEEGFIVSVYEKGEEPPAVVRRRFDVRGNLLLVIHHDGARESFDVDERGLVARHFDRLGAVTQYFHDAQGNCTAIVRPGNRTEHMEYDYLGRLVRHVDAAGRETTWTWDRRSEILEKRVTGGGTYRMRHNAARKVTLLDENGRVTRYTYGGQDWLVRIDEPAGNVTELRYDVHGRLVTVQNGRGQTFTERYDYAGRRVGWTTFEGVTYSATYDSMERVTSVRDPMGRVVWSYDGASRLEALAFNDGTSVELAYEGRGGPSLMGGSLVPVERYLDAFGRLHGEKMGEHTLRVTWNGGAPTGLESYVGLPLRYDYYEHCDQSAERIGSHGRVIDRPAGGDMLTSLGSKLVLRRRYGARGELLFQSLGRRMVGLADEEVALPGLPGTVFFAEYEYDASLNLLSEKRSDGSSVRMELTQNGQVSRRTRMDRLGKTLSDEELAYDGAGSPRVVGAQYDPLGRPTAYHGESFTYDAIGRLSSRTTDLGVFKYEWNGLDQLVRVVAPDRVVEMDYDPRGRRIRKRVYRQRELVKKTSYVWNNNLVVHEVDELAGTTRTYDRIDGSWLTFGHVDRTATAERSVFYVLDPMGCVQLAVDADGNVVWEAERTVYGHCDPRGPAQGSADVNARLANQFWDADVELAYTWHRWYDARLGLFVSTDPLFLDGNQNPRDYAPNPLNPLNGIDPTGWHSPPTAASTMAQPGPHAGPHPGPGVAQPGCVPCPPNMFRRRGRPNAATQAAIDNAGAAHGCHSCGASSPGTASGHWIGDHQPPLSTFGPGGPPAGANIWLYPHCAGCSPRQGGFMSHHATTIGPGAALAANPPASAA